MPSPTPRTALDPVVSPLTSPDVPNMLKNMKPPAFKGEERECSKDAVNTFLYKWSDLHALHRTPDNICALETSLSLEGKAYKWWMSLKMADRPTSWTQFQEVFRKEFLPENAPDRNWAAWDKCRMDKLTLTQYISKYREIILKLEGLDDFQKVRGFLRGLNDEYKTKVKTQYPKTLEDAIKSAQIFDDSLDKASKLKQESLFDYATYESKFVDLWERWVASLREGEGAPYFLKKGRFIAGLWSPLKDKVKGTFSATYEFALEVTRLKDKKLRIQAQAVKREERVEQPQL
ncbi:hypothetical protein L7F22_029581 [Adiantum nelumboides]|nr:hypothetical protein [Adiantum nelumboides]